MKKIWIGYAAAAFSTVVISISAAGSEIAPWQFLTQLATFQPPAGCTIQTPGIDGLNYNPALPFTIKLTNQDGKSDSVVVAPDARFDVEMNRTLTGATVTNTYLIDTQRSIETQMPPKGLSYTYVRVGQLSCGKPIVD